MARNPRKPASSRARDGFNPATGLPWRLRAPREERAVGSKIVRSPTGKSERVPAIAITGKWLEDRGFRSGVRFLLLADAPNTLLLALVDVD